MSKRIKLIDWTPVLKLVLLIGHPWPIVSNHLFISKSIYRYIMNHLMQRGLLLIHCSFHDFEPEMQQEVVFIPRPSVFKHQGEIPIGTLRVGDDFTAIDTIFYTIIVDGRVVIDTSMCQVAGFAPVPDVSPGSHLKLRTEFANGVITIFSKNA